MTETRILTLQDINQVLDLYASQEKIMGMSIPFENKENFAQQMQDFYLNPAVEKRILFGTFVDQDLKAAMGMVIWNEMPYWTLTRLIVKKGPKTVAFNPALNGIDSCLRSCLEWAENLGCYRYFVMSSLRHHEGLASAGMSHPSLGERYAVFVEEVVLANQRPKYNYVWQMMGQVTWPQSLVVRSGALLNQYREKLKADLSQRHLRHYEQEL